VNPWIVVLLIALALGLAGALYIPLRWRSSPQAFDAMIAVAQVSVARAAWRVLANGSVNGGLHPNFMYKSLTILLKVAM